jgi:hypothetical protein
MQSRGRADVEYAVRNRGRTFRVTREQVIKALKGVAPERIHKHGVYIGKVAYPVRQAFATAFGVDRDGLLAEDARRTFRRMGFDLYMPRPADGKEMNTVEEGEQLGWLPVEDQVLQTGPILLEWFRWCRWPELAVSEKSPDLIPIPQKPGVYEVRFEAQERRLYIGKATNLERRIKQDLIRGYHVHPAGPALRKRKDKRRILIRWADTDRPAAAEEELHRLHVERFDAYPKYTQRT